VDLSKSNHDDGNYALDGCHEYGLGWVMYTALEHWEDALCHEGWFREAHCRLRALGSRAGGLKLLYFRLLLLGSVRIITGVQIRWPGDSRVRRRERNGAESPRLRAGATWAFLFLGLH